MPNVLPQKPASDVEQFKWTNHAQRQYFKRYNLTTKSKVKIELETRKIINNAKLKKSAVQNEDTLSVVNGREVFVLAKDDNGKFSIVITYIWQ